MRGSSEEDLSAEHPQAQQDARLSQADEHPRGSVGHQEEAAEGAQAPQRLVPPAMPAKRPRLSRSSDFQRIYRQGSSTASRFLVLYWFRRPAEGGSDGPRLGLSVSKKLGGAMIWALDLDDFRNKCGCETYPLLKTINRVLRNYPAASANCAVKSIVLIFSSLFLVLSLHD